MPRTKERPVIGDSRLPLRFWAKVQPADTGCWLWNEGSLDWSGYGQYWYDGATRGAHRVAYGLLVGDIPEGLQIDHLCRTPSCVNPEHLEVVAPKENTLRGNTLPALNAAKT